MFCYLANFQYICSKNSMYGKIYHARPHCLEEQRG